MQLRDRPITVQPITPEGTEINISGQSPSYMYDDPLGYNPFG